MVSINIIYNSLKSNYITDSSGSTSSGTSPVGAVAGGVSGSIAFVVIVVICAVLVAIGKCSKSTYNFDVNRQQNTSTTTNSRVVTSRSSTGCTSTNSTRTASQPNYSGTTVTYTHKLQDACPPSYTEIHSYPQVQYPPTYPGYETNIAYLYPTATAPVSQVRYENVTTPVATAANYETPNGQSHQDAAYEDMSNFRPPSPPNYSEICNN